MESKDAQRLRGELTKRAQDDYHRMVKLVAAYFGKARKLETIRATDFERYRNTLPKTWGPTTVNNHLRLVRVLFKYANDIEATEREIRYKIGLKSIPKATVRKHEAKQENKEFSTADIHSLLGVASPPMKAFILLGINAGYGTMDIARLKKCEIDFDNQWLGEPRGKTGISRGCWLWPETLGALREAVDVCPFTTVDRYAELAFLTRHRQPWAKDGGTSHPLTAAFSKLKTAANLDRVGVGHYSLRHTFETQASGSRDQQAVDFVMGHHDQSMAGVYRQGIDPKRVKAVCGYVRQWLFGIRMSMAS